MDYLPMSNCINIYVLLIAQPAVCRAHVLNTSLHIPQRVWGGGFFPLSRLSERIRMRSVSEHRTLSLNSKKDTKAPSSTVQHVAILCVSVQFVLLLTITSYSRGDPVN